MKISLLIPTRSRPKRVKATIQSIHDTTTNPDRVEVWLMTDYDDPDPICLEDLQKMFSSMNINELKMSRQTYLGEYYNKVYQQCDGDIIGLMSDDITFVLQGWDVIHEQIFRDNPIFLTHSDVSHSLPFTHSFISRKSIEILGYVLPGYFKHGYLDFWLAELYRGINKHESVVTTLHRHYMNVPVDMSLYDNTYKDREGVDEEDEVIYNSLKHERQADIQKLQEYINSGAT